MSKSKVLCCVSGCNSSANRDVVSFHHFPKNNSFNIEIISKNGTVENVDVRKIWEKNLRFGKKITNASRVCSKHFDESDFYTQSEDIRHADLCLRPRKTTVRRRKLKRNAVPTKNLPTITHENSKKEGRRNNRSVQPIVKSDCEVMTQNQDENEGHAKVTIHTPNELLAAEALCVILPKA
ncbi:uncharacterized protein LOC123682815 [Harmonia axyridis]|uniref:uncharacterized protein LOC123682815 n=1 Tax=Harmonia axyridis TaxID=115357 RepID=UPI001E275B78|nr:uncharacterized protein LOC123682815 [Harmonia axyridis]